MTSCSAPPAITAEKLEKIRRHIPSQVVRECAEAHARHEVRRRHDPAVMPMRMFVTFDADFDSFHADTFLYRQWTEDNMVSVAEFDPLTGTLKAIPE